MHSLTYTQTHHTVTGETILLYSCNPYPHIHTLILSTHAFIFTVYTYTCTISCTHFIYTTRRIHTYTVNTSHCNLVHPYSQMHTFIIHSGTHTCSHVYTHTSMHILTHALVCPYFIHIYTPTSTQNEFVHTPIPIPTHK